MSFEGGSGDQAYRRAFLSKLTGVVTMNGIENILRWFAEISAALGRQIGYFSRPRLPASDIVDETPSGGAAGETGDDTSAADTAIVAPNVQSTFISADAKIGQEALISRVGAPPTDEQEIQRRRALIRTLFNDFWSEREDKPATFVDRLDQAETFLNDRLTACGEHWQLDGESRKILGLPLRSNSRNQGNGAALPI
jgi:hypothetical protein